MQLKEEAAITLGKKLGDAAHVSGLAMRLARISGAREKLPEWLMCVAVARGARHYERDFDPSLPPDQPSVSDEEIGVALCLEQLPYDLDHLRAAAQLLSSPKVNAEKLCRLAVQERCEPVLLHIAHDCKSSCTAARAMGYSASKAPRSPGSSHRRSTALDSISEPHWDDQGGWITYRLALPA